MHHAPISESIQSDSPNKERLIPQTGKILVTGANGFIGSRLVRNLLSIGMVNIRCLVRSESNAGSLRKLGHEFGVEVEFVYGNLLSPKVCRSAAEDVLVVYHLAVGGGKNFPGSVMNTVVTTRNLLDAVSAEAGIRRFVNVSSLAVYANDRIKGRAQLNESCPVEIDLIGRYDPYAYSKAWQDNLVRKYAREMGIPYVIVRPGVVFGPGKPRIPGRVGIGTFGIFMHIGHGNRMPLTYVDNCAEAIALAGLVPGIESEEFLIVDDNLPTSRQFLRGYKNRARRFASIPVPYHAFYLFSLLWEKYSSWSHGQLPPVFNRKTCVAYFKGNRYSNQKAKERLHWRPRVGMADALNLFFASIREGSSER